jgi:hypothetical protein
MSAARYVHWQDGEMRLGYFEEFPGYLSHGDSIEGLEENLRDLYNDLTSGEIPCIRGVAELSFGRSKPALSSKLDFNTRHNNSTITAAYRHRLIPLKVVFMTTLQTLGDEID